MATTDGPSDAAPAAGPGLSGSLWWALPMLLAFSAGLAGVLIVIGVAVVHTKSWLGGRWEQSRLYRALPLLSAVLVTGMGLWLCYSSVHGGP